VCLWTSLTVVLAVANTRHFQGKTSSKAYNANVRENTVRWAMVDMLKSPPAGFEDVVKVSETPFRHTDAHTRKNVPYFLIPHHDPGVVWCVVCRRISG